MSGALATLTLGGWPEPFGLVAIESMATGTPVLARRAGGCTETIEHGITGFLVGDVDEAIHAVSRLKAIRRPHIAAYARSRFSAERMVDRYEQVYELLIAQRRRGPLSAGAAHDRQELATVARASSHALRHALASAPGRSAARSIQPGQAARAGPAAAPPRRRR
jgi:Glycosyl transferases group 1